MFRHPNQPQRLATHAAYRPRAAGERRDHALRRHMPAGEALVPPTAWSTDGTFFAPHRLPMMNTFTLLSFVVTFLAGATAGAWVNALTNRYAIASRRAS